MARSTARTWTFRVLALALSSVAILALIEVGLRIAIPSSTVRLFQYQPGSSRQKIMRPDARGTVYGVPFETNEAGFRSALPFSAEKAPGVFRIAALGDSFTVSAGVAYEEIMTRRLERRMSETLSRPVEVYNLAVGGHEILHHAATLEEVALDYHPDLILLFLFPYNDLDVAGYDRETKLLASHSGSGPMPPPERRPFWRRSLRITQVAMLQWQVVARRVPILANRIPPLQMERTVEMYRTRGAAWQRSLAALRRMAAQAESAGTPLRVFLLPLNGRTYAGQAPLYSQAAELVEEAGLSGFSLIDGFAATGRQPREFGLNWIDPHPNSAYNAVAAELVLEKLIETGLVPPAR